MFGNNRYMWFKRASLTRHSVRRKPLLLTLALFVFAVAAACSSGSEANTPTPIDSGQVPVENPDGTGRPDSPVLTGDARRGLDSYLANGCSTCHSGEDLSLGPSHLDVYEIAGTRVVGLSADEYIEQSIREPQAFIAPGYESPSIMPEFDELTDDEIRVLIAYMKTLTPPTETPVVDAGSLPPGNPEEGRRLYGTIGCSGCHSLGSDRIVGPGFAAVGTRAAVRREGLTADEYLIESIIDPGTFIVAGFPRQMPAFDELPPQQIADLLAFLKSLN